MIIKSYIRTYTIYKHNTQQAYIVTHSDCSFCIYSLFFCSLALFFLLLLSALPVQFFAKLHHSSAVSNGDMSLCYCSILVQLIVFCMCTVM